LKFSIFPYHAQIRVLDHIVLKLVSKGLCEIGGAQISIVIKFLNRNIIGWSSGPFEGIYPTVTKNRNR
jgi:hypothetical protein